MKLTIKDRIWYMVKLLFCSALPIAISAVITIMAVSFFSKFTVSIILMIIAYAASEVVFRKITYSFADYALSPEKRMGAADILRVYLRVAAVGEIVYFMICLLPSHTIRYIFATVPWAVNDYLYRHNNINLYVLFLILFIVIRMSVKFFSFFLNVKKREKEYIANTSNTYK